ncbi:MAG: tRNA pseudouridine(55) synthase TruB [Eubacterium sp.]|nr:tRNA pseudouridine(55) synthase TruB [Eubacterium sp.]
MYNGILNIYKEEGYTSFDVVALLRGILHQKKIGHTGTLDPKAEGVLVVCLGKATKLCEILTADTKEYETVLKLGETSDTDDSAGCISVNSGFSIPDEETIRESFLSFLGTYDQLPPRYAAIKVGGKKLYEYAREGKEVPQIPRSVTIHELEISEIKYPYVRFRVKCSKGTYIRSLCRDIGEKLGTGGLMDSLLRRQSGEYKLEDCLKLGEVKDIVQNGNIEDYILPVDTLLCDWPAADITEEGKKYLLNGNKLSESELTFRSENEKNRALKGDRFRVYMDKELKALYKYDPEKGRFMNYKMML